MFNKVCCFKKVKFVVINKFNSNNELIRQLFNWLIDWVSDKSSEYNCNYSSKGSQSGGKKYYKCLNLGIWSIKGASKSIFAKKKSF